MTTFDRPVTRVTVGTYNVLYSGFAKARAIVVTLKVMGGDDMIEFREKGTRGRWLLPVDAAFKSAVARRAFKERMEKGRARAARRR